MSPTIIIGLCSIMVVAAILLLLPEEKSKASRRASAISVSHTSGDSQKAEKKGLFGLLLPNVENSARRKNVEESINKLEERNANRIKRLKSLPAKLIQAGWEMNAITFNVISIVIGIFAGLIVFMITGKLLIAGGAVVGIGFGLPRLFLNMAISRRQSKFISSFADAMDIIVRGVRTGLPLNDCLKIIAHESPEPVSTEFSRVVEAENLGMPLDVCLEQMYERMPVSEVSFFATVLNIQRQTGGNLGEALSNLSSVLRGRKMLAEKIKALSAEAKMSAIIIGSLPIIVGILVNFAAPDYMYELFHTETGQRNMMIGAALMAMGTFMMKKMIAFKY